MFFGFPRFPVVPHEALLYFRYFIFYLFGFHIKEESKSERERGKETKIYKRYHSDVTGNDYHVKIFHKRKSDFFDSLRLFFLAL